MNPTQSFLWTAIVMVTLVLVAGAALLVAWINDRWHRRHTHEVEPELTITISCDARDAIAGLRRAERRALRAARFHAPQIPDRKPETLTLRTSR